MAHVTAVAASSEVAAAGWAGLRAYLGLLTRAATSHDLPGALLAMGAVPGPGFNFFNFNF